MTDERLRVALIERADEWSNRNRVSTTWRLVNDLRDELVRMSSGRADHDAAVERAAAVKALREAARAAEAFADKAIEQRDDSDYPESHYGNRLDGVAWGSYQVSVSLHDRADRIESGEQA